MLMYDKYKMYALSHCVALSIPRVMSCPCWKKCLFVGWLVIFFPWFLSPFILSSFALYFLGVLLIRGATGGGGRWGRPPHAFHNLAKDVYLNRSASYFTLGQRPYVLSHSSYYNYTCSPFSKLPRCAPVANWSSSSYPPLFRLISLYKFSPE